MNNIGAGKKREKNENFVLKLNVFGFTRIDSWSTIDFGSIFTCLVSEDFKIDSGSRIDSSMKRLCFCVGAKNLY